jgi:predicted acyltransferase
MPSFPALPATRQRSIDAFRGLTFLVMVFVNQLHGVSGMPAWAKHMPADADAMSFVDVVFPAFLFIVGLSIPFALDQRLRRGDAGWTLQRHVLARALALIVMGYFMVNAESGFDERFMALPIALWALLSYLAFALLWGRFGRDAKPSPAGLRALGVLLLFVLAALYRGGADGRQTMTPQWWGILGLIGWAYLVATLLYQLSRGRVATLLVLLAGCAAYYVVSHRTSGADNPVQRWLLSHDGHAAHTSIVLCGTVCALLFFDRGGPVSERRRFIAAALFALALACAGVLLRPLFGISKIYATPSWCFFSAAWCVVLFAVLHALVDLRNVTRWTQLVQPAASNPLVLYLLPFVIEALLQWSGVSLPAWMGEGASGAAWAALYAVIVMALTAAVGRLGFRMVL